MSGERRTKRDSERDLHTRSLQIIRNNSFPGRFVNATRELIQAAPSLLRLRRVARPQNNFFTWIAQGHFGAKALIALVATSMLATFSTPAYAYAPDVTSLLSEYNELNPGVPAADTQSFKVSDEDVMSVYRPASYQVVPVSKVASMSGVKAWRFDGSPSAEEQAAATADVTLDYDSVVNVAKTYVGVPYVFGGADPNGFDCSGYVRFVYSQFGILLPHSVTDQNTVGKRVSRAHAVPGDLVVWNDGSHVGIYAGGWSMYHAPRSGDKVRYFPIFSTDVHFVHITHG
jgi:cell wall-associated NlpC family hydrolase